MSMGIQYPGTIPWRLAIALFFAWCIVAGVLIKGVQSLGKIVYVTAIFPYIMLTILLVNNCLQPGAVDGIIYYLEPKWERLADFNVWADAASQIFFSLSCCYGGLVAMSSYNQFKNNIHRDTIMICLINCGTSFYAGFSIFSALGTMAHAKGVNVSDVATTGPELAFVAYPQALSRMPVAPLWSILFFIMMCLLGFGSAFSTVETVVTSIMDEYPSLRSKFSRSIIFRLSIFLGCFTLGLPMITEGGLYLLTLVDENVGGLPLLIVGMFETIALCVNNFCDIIKEMVGFRPSIFWQVLWWFFTPVLLIGLVALKIRSTILSPTSYTGFFFSTDCPYTYPNWAYVLAWLMILTPVMFVFIGFVYELFRAVQKNDSFMDVMESVSRPAKGWESQEARYHEPAAPLEMIAAEIPSGHGIDLPHSWSLQTVSGHEDTINSHLMATAPPDVIPSYPPDPVTSHANPVFSLNEPAKAAPIAAYHRKHNGPSYTNKGFDNDNTKY